MQADKQNKDDIDDILEKYTKSNKRWRNYKEKLEWKIGYRDYMGSLTQRIFESGLHN